MTIRRRYGPWALARALAEYAVLVLLVALLATSGAVAPAERAMANSPRPPAAAQEATSLPPGISQVVDAGRRLADAGRWLAELWDQAKDMTEPPPDAQPKPKEDP